MNMQLIVEVMFALFQERNLTNVRGSPASVTFIRLPPPSPRINRFDAFELRTLAVLSVPHCWK